MRRTCTWTVFLTVLLLVSGCRTYGDYGAEEATYNQIQRVLERSEERLSRAQADLRALQAAASGSPTLEVLAAQYVELIAAHEAVLEEQRSMAAELSPGSDYRTLHRVYGALVTEQQLLRDQYQGVLRYVYDAYATDTTVTSNRDQPYAIVPPYYARVRRAGEELTVNEVVGRVRSGAAPSDFSILMPEAPSEPDHADEEGRGGGH